jgi:predicted glycosyltransferase
LIRYVNYWFIKKFDECWIPDFEGTVNLAGILSHPKKLPENACFIGPLSHLNLQISKVNLAPEINSDYDILLILSGPEPQRSILEKNLLEQLITTSYSCLIVKGKPLENSFARSAKISIISHLNSSQLARLIVKTPVVISRSGYSTIMDMISLKKSAILIPTPGQTEQEYLAQYVMKNKWFYCVSQDKFNLESAIKRFKDFLPDNFPQIESTLDKRLRKLI